MASSLNQPGFLTKMVKLIRSSSAQKEPLESASVLSRLPADDSSEPERMAERIRSRRNDNLVRRREFDYLRKVRAQRITARTGVVPRPSVFQNSSMFNPEGLTADDRDSTVRKIDAIEAQMTDQWLQRKRTAGSSPGAPVVTPAALRAPAGPARGAPSAVAPVAITAPVTESPAFESMDLDFTTMLAQEALNATVSLTETPEKTLTELATAATVGIELSAIHQPDADTRPMVFRTSQTMTVDMGEHTKNPALHEAAFRFAQGDDDGAEAALIAGLQSPDAVDDTAEACSAALLDLYRATAQQSNFDVVAIEYAQLFGRSAPEWYSVADLNQGAERSGGDSAEADNASPSRLWKCPPILDLAGTIDLQALLGQVGQAKLLWDGLQSIDARAAPALLVLFRQWSAQSIELHFSAPENLLRVLSEATVVGDRNLEKVWWDLRLEALRMLDMQEPFEDAAMDFCITYEVSPPSWVERAVLRGPLESKTPGTAQPAVLALQGVLQGDISGELQRLRQRQPVGDTLTISCARLVRLDFAAAGSILNWVIATQSEAVAVQFVNVPRLLAPYFDAMGISAHATVSSGKR
jgi:ABC-type transporter Mla MlaB component